MSLRHESQGFLTHFPQNQRMIRAVLGPVYKALILLPPHPGTLFLLINEVAS